MPGCPNSYETGCRCIEHDLGLALHAPDPAAYLEQLDEARPTRLHVVTFPPDSRHNCDQTMTCSCETCTGERAARTTGTPDIPQPWQPRPSRRAA